MKHDMTRHIMDKIARAKEGLRHTLSILFEYAWSMARVWLEYAWSMPRVWVEYASTLLSGGQKLCADEITSRPLRDYGSLLTRLRLVVTLLLLMFVGVGEMWADDEYSGTYYIASNAKLNGKFIYNANTPESNYYLCPTENWISFGTSGETMDTWTTGDDKPFLTTYKINADKSYVRAKAKWTIEYYGKEDEKDYYYIKHSSEKYLVLNKQIKGVSGTNNQNRIRVHLENLTSENLEDENTRNLALFAISRSGSSYIIDPKTKATYYLTVNKGNGDPLQGENRNGGGTITSGSTTYGMAGTLGIFQGTNDDTRYFCLEEYIFPPTITFNNATNEVTISTTTSGATIYYTIGDNPDDPTSTSNDGYGDSGSSTVTIPIPSVTNPTTIKAIAIKGNLYSDVTPMTITKVATPTLVYDSDNKKVTLECATTDADIYYRKGTTGDYSLYSIPFDVVNDDVIYAYATKEGWLNSDSMDPYTVRDICAKPTININYNADGTAAVTMSCETEDATIRYTTDGSAPVESTTAIYPGIFANPVTSGMTIKAIATKDGLNPSNVASAIVEQVAMPVITIENSTIKITCATDGATIYYTVDGGDATAYIGALGFEASGKAITAYATKTGMVTSAMAEADANSTKLQLAAPVITYNRATNKVVITSVAGATIKYSTGQTETEAGDPTTEYTGTGFDLPDYHHVIKAKAEMGTAESSDIASLTLVIQPTTDDNHPRPYLIQSVECTDFYMIPGDKANNIFYLNTSSLGSASMEWCFYYAGNEGGVDYYFIKNNNFTSNPYLRYADDRISMQTTATFNAANETGKKAYWFSIVYANTTSNPEYYIHPYNNATVGNGLCKSRGNNASEKGNNVTNVVNLADATNTANSNARWNFIPSTSYSVPLPFTAWGEGGDYKYYKIKKEATSTVSAHYLLPRTETVSYAIASVASNVSGSENSISWYFDKDDASSDKWVSYYYVVNAATGEYLYFNGDKTKASNENAFEVKEELVESEKDRYLFAFTKSTTANFCYILPKALQQIWKKNDYHLIYWDNSANNIEAPLTTAENRTSDQGKWTFEEVAVADICPPKVSLDAAGNVNLIPRTRGAVIKYTVDGESEQTFNGSTDPITTLPSEGGQVVITTKTSLVGDPAEELINVVYKPTIVLDSDQSIVYNGQTHAPELSSVTMGTAELKDHCVVSSDNINAGEATAVITQIEGDPDYVIYGTAPFTIAQSPLTIYADSKMIEYGEERPELTFSTFGLASSDVVEVNLSCAPGTEIGNYPITFDGTYTITRQVDGTNAIPNYKDITLVASSLIITGKSLGDGVHFAEGITAEVTPSGDSYNVSVMRNMASIGSDNYEVTSPDTKGYYNDKIWTITGKGHYAGSAKFAFIQSDFTERDGEYRAAYVASYDWAIPEGSNIEAWIATTVNPSVNVLQVKPVDYLPAGVPVVLTATVDKSGGFVVYPKSNETVDITNSQKEDNKLKVVTAENGITVNDREKYVYSKGEFVLAYGGLLSQGKIYIDRPANVSGARLRIVKDNDVTGISDVSEDNKTWIFDDIWYSLDGRKLSGKPSQKGIYINNGRKIVVN